MAIESEVFKFQFLKPLSHHHDFIVPEFKDLSINSDNLDKSDSSDNSIGHGTTTHKDEKETKDNSEMVTQTPKNYPQKMCLALTYTYNFKKKKFLFLLAADISKKGEDNLRAYPIGIERPIPILANVT